LEGGFQEIPNGVNSVDLVTLPGRKIGHGSGVDQVFLNKPGIEIALDEMKVLKHLAVKRNRRMDAIDGELFERTTHRQDGFLSRVAVDDQFAEKGIIVGRYRVAGINM